MSFLKKIRGYLKITGSEEIARRYFIINSFDGVLPVLGIILGFYFSGILDPKVITAAGLGVGVAMFISGVSAAYLSEKAERIKDLKALEGAMIMNMGKTLIGRASIAAPIFTALVNGASPLLSAIMVIFPFFFSPSIITEMAAFYISITLAATLLFILGAFLGKLSKENMFLYGIKTLLAGIATGGILYIIGLL